MVARVHEVRLQAQNCFLELRQDGHSVQAFVNGKALGKSMVVFAGGISRESIVRVHAVLCDAPTRIKACSVHDRELHVKEMYVLSRADPKLPIQLEEKVPSGGDGAMEHHAALQTRLDHRVLDLRVCLDVECRHLLGSNSRAQSPVNQAIFRVQSAVCQAFRSFLLQEGFMEIHTPKIISAASEGGAEVFPVTYFDRRAYLAQSPQLYKQMAVCADFPRVFEVGPVFRAEDSNTPRHMTGMSCSGFYLSRDGYQLEYHRVYRA